MSNEFSLRVLAAQGLLGCQNWQEIYNSDDVAFKRTFSDWGQWWTVGSRQLPQPLFYISAFISSSTSNNQIFLPFSEHFRNYRWRAASRGQILRTLLNWMGTFDTPYISISFTWEDHILLSVCWSPTGLLPEKLSGFVVRFPLGGGV